MLIIQIWGGRVGCIDTQLKLFFVSVYDVILGNDQNL